MSSIRTLLVVVLVAAAGLIAFAVWQDRTTDTVNRPAFNAGDVIAVEGCLTAASGVNAFALTPVGRDPLTSAMTSRTNPTMFTYELVGDPDALRGFVGRRVRIHGLASNPGEDNVELDRERATPPAGQGEESEARVETREEMEIAVRRLEVRSVESIPGTCPTEGS
ncbi:MAG TPA: hypothetical protein VF198_02885 [Vicinamibacterales bacterium]